MAAWPPEWIRQALNTVLTTTGDIAYRAASGVTRLAIGSTHHVLTVAGGVPTWAAGSKATLGTTGDILYASAPNVLAALAAPAPGHVLTGNGVGVAPSWQAVSSAPVMSAGWTSAAAYSWFGPVTSGWTETDASSGLVLNPYWGLSVSQSTTAAGGNVANLYSGNVLPVVTEPMLVWIDCGFDFTVASDFVCAVGNNNAAATAAPMASTAGYYQTNTTLIAFWRTAAGAQTSFAAASPMVTGGNYRFVFASDGVDATVGLWDYGAGDWLNPPQAMPGAAAGMAGGATDFARLQVSIAPSVGVAVSQRTGTTQVFAANIPGLSP